MSALEHSLVLKTDGNLWTADWKLFGQLEKGSTTASMHSVEAQGVAMNDDLAACPRHINPTCPQYKTRL